MMSEDQRISIIKEALKGADAWKRLAYRLLHERPSQITRTSDSASASADSLWLMKEEEFDSDHPQGDCAAVHPNVSHSDWKDKQEEEPEGEEERFKLRRFPLPPHTDSPGKTLAENTLLQKQRTLRKLTERGIKPNHGPSSREVKE